MRTRQSARQFPDVSELEGPKPFARGAELLGVRKDRLDQVLDAEHPEGAQVLLHEAVVREGYLFARLGNLEFRPLVHLVVDELVGGKTDEN